MAASKLAGSIYGQAPKIDIKPLRFSSLGIDKLWVDYDRDTDSMVIYLATQPVRGVTIYLDNDTYVIVKPGTGEIIGFQVDAWERSFLLKHKDLQAVWPEIKQTISPEEGWSEPLKGYLFVAVLLLGQMFSPDNNARMRSASA